jgi:TRAP-type C4-dicarboxylate transport system substrate-binding protein
MNKGVWDKLSAGDKQIFLDAAKEAVKANRARVDKDDANGVAELRKKGMHRHRERRQGQVHGGARTGVRRVREAVRQGQSGSNPQLQVSRGLSAGP